MFLLGWNENLQPHGSLLDQFDTTDLEEVQYALLIILKGINLLTH